MNKLRRIRIRDCLALAGIVIMFYGLTVFACALDDACSAIHMVPLP